MRMLQGCLVTLSSVVIFSFISQIDCRTDSIEVTLDAKWSSTSVLAEYSEFLASIDRSYFWSFLEILHHEFMASPPVGPLSSKDQWKTVSRLNDKLHLPPAFWQLADLSLASRVYSPAVQMQRQIAYDLGLFNSTCSVGSGHPSTWLVIGDKKVCTCSALNDLQSLIRASEIPSGGNSSSSTASTILRSDKVYPGPDSGHSIVTPVHTLDVSDSKPVIILYADLVSTDVYYCFHEKLAVAAKEGQITYVFRHFSNPTNEKTRLSGYGVELAMKSTEYKAVDDTAAPGQNKDATSDAGSGKSAAQEDEVQGFIFSKLHALYPNLTESLDKFRRHLLETDSEIRPLKAWQFQDLSLQAAYQVFESYSQAGQQNSMEPLRVLRDLSQNFPMRASAIASVSVPTEFRQAVEDNQRILEGVYGLSAGQFYMTVNGRSVSGSVDAFSLMSMLKHEMQLLTDLHSLGLQGSDINIMVNTLAGNMDADSTMPTGGTRKTSEDFILDLREAPIVWLNDLQKDAAYSSWPKSLQALLMPTYPGMLRRLAKNIFNLVVVSNPADTKSETNREAMKYIEAFLIHNIPIRMGFLWAVPNDANEASVAIAMIRAFNYILAERETWDKAIDFFTAMHTKFEGQEMTVEDIQKELRSRHKDADIGLIFSDNSDYDTGVKSSGEFIKSSGLSLGEAPHLLLNGHIVDKKALRESGFEETVLTLVMQHTSHIQQAVYDGSLRDDHDAFQWLMTRPNVVSRLNARLMQTTSSSGTQPVQALLFGKPSTGARVHETEEVKEYKNMNQRELSEEVAAKVKYFVKKEDSSASRKSTSQHHVVVSQWLVCDLSTPQGRSLVYEAMRALKGGLTASRIAVIPHGGSWKEEAALRVTKLLHAALQHLPMLQARNFITKIVKEENFASMKSLEDLIVGGMELDTFQKQVDALDLTSLRELYNLFARSVVNLSAGQNLVIANGRLYGPLNVGEVFMSDDFRLLERLTSDNLGNRVAEQLRSENIADSEDEVAELTMKISSVFMLHSGKEQQSMLETPKRVHLSNPPANKALRFYGDFSLPTLDLLVIMDPLTREMQRISHMLLVMRQALNCNLHIIFNPKHKHSESPLKSFYRYVWPSSSMDTSAGHDGEWAHPKAYFSRVPGQPLLTMGVDAPHSWMVEAVSSVYDLDNLRLVDIHEASGKVVAGYELEYLLLEGHCIDSTMGQPPRGLQFILGTQDKPEQYDTIVMANLGYFQLKANPGAWYLQLREGKSREIYNIASHEYTDSPSDSPEVVAVIDSFLSKIIRVRVTKKPDKLQDSVLAGAGDNEDPSLWSSISNAFIKKPQSNEEKDEQINVFSVASGHLYERFLRIMMLSVLKNTKSKVKFWFLKNYLSPSFKDFIPHMAQEYGFEYELVQYKWPRWLHAQTEKQRIIWGYKILFLDVLFPLNVKKIIFVDADQTVRSDLQELVDLDLEGAPYGYTPFCNSRTEMDGFRFWKQGYWAQHLSGRPYHISALYVVDLVRFRLLAAGDRLRGQYHGLSQDPNSLSNLDQDLPNNMIHQVPIKSLPQEWLWCETWCSDAEKTRAKTIDLCNNPMTKEPKLSAAMRIVPEWRDLDAEIRALWNRLNIAQEAASTTHPDKTTSSQEKPVEHVTLKEDL